MKKALSFLRSMRFGMILLSAIAALSIVGTLVTQGQSSEYYAQAYAGWDSFILSLGLDHLYTTWYYGALFAALCLNLTFCSILRVGKVQKAKENLLTHAESAVPIKGINPNEAADALRRLSFRKNGDLYTRRISGLYGSLVTHIGMLLVVIAAACVFRFENQTDAFILVGDTMSLESGASITVNRFTMEDESGQLEYASELTLTSTDGKQKTTTLRVNHPVRFEGHTVYQQNYAFAGVLDVQTSLNEKAEQAVLTKPAFLSLDGMNGIYFMQVFGNYTRHSDGQIEPLDTVGGVMVNPAYMMTLISDGQQKVGMTFPGETFEVGGVYYTFKEPIAYPGLRVKTQPYWVIPLLYTSFAVLVIGLYLCFFCVPAVVLIRKDGVRVASSKEAQDIIEQIQDMVEYKKE